MRINLFGVDVDIDLQKAAAFIEACVEQSNQQNEEKDREKMLEVKESIETYLALEKESIDRERKELYKRMKR